MGYHYYYKDKNDGIHEVTIYNQVDQDNEKSYYSVSVADHIEAYQDLEPYRNSDSHELESHAVTKYRQTKELEIKNYQVSKSTFLIFERWSVEEN